MGGIGFIGAVGSGDVPSLDNEPWQVDTDSSVKMTATYKNSGAYFQQVDGHQIVKKNDKAFLSMGASVPYQITDYNIQGIPVEFNILKVNLDPENTKYEKQAQYVLSSVTFWSDMKNKDSEIILEKIKHVEDNALMTHKPLTKENMPERAPKTRAEKVYAFMTSILGQKKPVMTKVDWENKNITEYRIS